MGRSVAYNKNPRSPQRQVTVHEPAAR